MVIGLTILFATLTVGFCAWCWREEVKEYGEFADHGECAITTFIIAPFAGFMVALAVDILICVFNIWLLVIILVVLLVLAFVYWDYIKKYMSDKRGE